MLEFLLLSCGLLGLWLGSDILINGAISLADRYRTSDAAIGMLVLAVGTDLPEIFVAVDASIRSLAGQDLTGIVIGSAVGSSIGQFGLVFGVAGFIGFAARPIRLAPRNTVFLLGGLLALALLSLDGEISRLEGGTLVALYAAYIWTLLVWSPAAANPGTQMPTHPLSRDVLRIVAGLALLLAAAELTVIYAARFALVVGMSKLTVSAIIIGMGSSLPELCVSLVALLRKRGSLSVGNLLGSNVLDTLLVPGIGAAIVPIAIHADVLRLDIPVQALLTVLVLGFLYVSPRGIRMAEAILLLAIYLAYAAVRLIG